MSKYIYSTEYLQILSMIEQFFKDEKGITFRVHGGCRMVLKMQEPSKTLLTKSNEQIHADTLHQVKRLKRLCSRSSLEKVFDVTAINESIHILPKSGD